MLITASEIIEKSWLLFKQNWRRLLPYMVLLFVPTLALSVLGFLGMYLDAWQPASAFMSNLLILALFVASLVFSLWVTIALTDTLGKLEQKGSMPPWQAAFNATAPLLWPFIYTSLLAGLVVLGGTILLIVPGVIFAVWYSFVSYTVVLDKQRGAAALAASKRLVIGRWAPILWRLLAPGVVFIFISVVARSLLLLPFYFIVSSDNALNAIDNIITAFTSSLIAPLATIAVLLLYRSAQTTPVELAPPGAPGTTPKK